MSVTGAARPSIFAAPASPAGLPNQSNQSRPVDTGRAGAIGLRPC